MINPQTEIPGSKQLFEDKPLIDTLKPSHPLLVIAKKINWNSLVESFSKYYEAKKGRPILAIRLMIGLLLLKYIYDLSDEDVVSQWQENIYYQAFTGQGKFTDGAPCSSSQLTLFRKRIGVEGCEIIFAESVRVHGDKVLQDDCIVDSTVQEKNTTYPTDAKLITKSTNIILRIGRFLEIPFRKIYKKERKDLRSKLSFGGSKLSDEEKSNCIQKLREIALSLLDTLIKKLPVGASKGLQIGCLLFILNKAITQQKNDDNKVYSIHEPQVKCIAKGKSHTKYEFGSKVSLILSKNSNIILGVLNFSNNPYDGDTLDPAIEQLSKLHNGYKPKNIVADRGYRGRKEVNGVKIVTPYDNEKGLLPRFKRWIKNLLTARISIEPIIGHLKSDHRLSRNFLKSAYGDEINPLCSAAAFNFMKYARVKDQRLRKPPRTLSLKITPKRQKYFGLPLWRPKPTLF